MLVSIGRSPLAKVALRPGLCRSEVGPPLSPADYNESRSPQPRRTGDYPGSGRSRLTSREELSGSLRLLTDSYGTTDRRFNS